MNACITHDLTWGGARSKHEVASYPMDWSLCASLISHTFSPSSLLRATDCCDLHFSCVGPSVPNIPSRSCVPAPLFSLVFLGFRSLSLRIYCSLFLSRRGYVRSYRVANQPRHWWNRGRTRTGFPCRYFHTCSGRGVRPSDASPGFRASFSWCRMAAWSHTPFDPPRLSPASTATAPSIITHSSASAGTLCHIFYWPRWCHF